MESVSEGGEGREGSEVKREGEGERGSVILFYINHERFFDIHRSVSLLFKSGGFAQDGKLDFLSKIQLSKKLGN